MAGHYAKIDEIYQSADLRIQGFALSRTRDIFNVVKPIVTMRTTIATFFALVALQLQAQTGTLLVTVTGLKNNTGKVMLSLHNQAGGFPGNNAVAYQEAAIQNNKASFKLAGLAYGTYAVSVYHDENSNKKMDTNFMAIPKEAYGASNDARGSMGPPKFNDAKFELNSAEKALTIKLP